MVGTGVGDAHLRGLGEGVEDGGVVWKSGGGPGRVAWRMNGSSEWGYGCMQTRARIQREQRAELGGSARGIYKHG